MKAVDLKSSIQKQGRYVNQVVGFVGGEKKTFKEVDTLSIDQGQFTKFCLKNGVMVMINDKNVLYVEVHKCNI
jgi:hypothetical protein